MKKPSFRNILLAFAMLTAVAVSGEEPKPFAWPDPAFRYGKRIYSKQEAEQIAQRANHGTPQEKIEQQKLLLSGIALCEKGNAFLSPDAAAQDIAHELLLLDASGRLRHRLELEKLQISEEEWIAREANRLERQFQAAIRAWYANRYPQSIPERIPEAQIQEWYYRHQNLFRDAAVDLTQVWSLDPQKPQTAKQVTSLLSQGVDAGQITRQYSAGTLPEPLTEWLFSPDVKKTEPAPGFQLYHDSQNKYLVLVKKEAVRHFYRPLDKALQEAIRLTIFDALARARFAAALRTELAAEDELEFFPSPNGKAEKPLVAEDH